MKKKNLIIPLVLICICVAAVGFISYFTTPLSISLSMAKNSPSGGGEIDYLSVFRETHKTMETVCKISPTVENYQYVSAYLYNSRNIGNKDYEKLSPDFTKKTLYYAEELMLTAEKPNSNIGRTYELEMFPDRKKAAEIYTTANYAKALVAAGDKEKAKKLAEECIYSLKGRDIQYSRIFSMFGFFQCIKELNNSDDLAWLVKVEQYMVDTHNPQIEAIKQAGNYYSYDVTEWGIDENGQIHYDYMSVQEAED